MTKIGRHLEFLRTSWTSIGSGKTFCRALSEDALQPIFQSTLKKLRRKRIQVFSPYFIHHFCFLVSISRYLWPFFFCRDFSPKFSAPKNPWTFGTEVPVVGRGDRGPSSQEFPRADRRVPEGSCSAAFTDRGANAKLVAQVFC